MATSGLYGSSPTGATVAAPGSESAGLYGNATTFGGSYFEWFIFIQSETQPATPTGGSWSFTTNSGTPPTGWSSTPPSAPTLPVWVSIALVNSKNTTSLVWSAPGLFAYASGLPILSGTGEPSSGTGLTDQLYIQTDTTPETIWFKQAGTWTRLTGSTLYADLISNQTIAGTKTFSSQIQGSISGTSSNVTGIVGISNGGTGSTTANGALTALGGIGSLTSTDGSVTITSPTATSRNLAVVSAGSTTNVLCQVRNTTGATLTKGTVVYISGATGQIPTVSKALATSDATSAQTLGMMTADLANNSNGYVTVIGLINDIDTSAYSDGAQLYLSGTTAGTVTATKPYAPIHLVYVAVVEYAHPTQGKLFVKVQNGYELDEIHNVSAQTPSNGQTIVYNTSTGLWTQNTVSLAIGVNGTLPIANGGTGQTTANAALNALLPTQTGNASKYLQTDGTNATWDAISLSTADITGILPTANGGTGRSSYTANSVLYASSTSAIASGSALTFDGTTLSNITGANGVSFFAYSNGETAERTTYSAIAGLQLASYQSVSGSPYTKTSDIVANADGTAPSLMRFWVKTSGNSSPSEAMRLTSTGLGIGTSSPAAALSVRTTGAQIDFSTSGTQIAFEAIDRAATTNPIDTKYYTRNGTFQWYNSSYAERMRLDASGNLGIGTSSPTIKLDISGTAQTLFKLTTTNTEANINFNINSSTNNFFGITGGANFFWNTGGSERMRLDNTGNLGIGITSPTAKVDASGTYRLQLRTDDATPELRSITANGAAFKELGINGLDLRFNTSNTERARIDTSGNLLVGTTTNTNTSKLVVNGTISQTVGGTQYLVVDQSDIGTGANEIPLNQYLGALAYQDNVSLTTNDITGVLPTANGGTGRSSYTANSVLYASSTSAIASGTALTFDGTTLTTSSNGSTPALRVYGAGTAQGQISFNSTDTYKIQSGPDYLGFNFFTNNVNRYTIDSTGVAIWFVGGSESMRLNSTGLGIGTSSPTQKLAIAATTGNGAAIEMAGNGNTLGTNSFYVGQGSGGDAYVYQRNATQPLVFGTNNTERMRLDSAGNLGLGVTPTQAYSLSRAFQIGNGGLIEARTNDYTTFSLATNAYLSSAGDWTYRSNAPANLFELSNSIYKWNQAPAGTGTISFTQAMTLNSSGNLLLGTTTSSGYNMTISGASSTVTGTKIINTSGSSSNLCMFAASSTYGSFGVASNSGWLAVEGANNLTVGPTGAGAVTFVNNATERARIDSSGNFLIGTTTSGVGNTGGTGIGYNAGASYQSIGHITGTASGSVYISFGYNGGAIANITQSGTTAVLYNVTSDQRLKENIQDADSASSLIDSLQVRQFDWKSDNTHQRYGFVAQELVTVAPEAVYQPNNAEEMMAVDYSKLVPMLVKEIQSLRARVTQLEG